MAVTVSKIVPEIRSGKRSIDTTPRKSGETRQNIDREYEVVYYVETSDPNDGPQVVVDGYTGPQLGNVYQVGNDIDRQAKCHEIYPKLISPEHSQQKWHVAAKFKTPSVEPQLAQYKRDIEVGTAFVTEPVETATLRTNLWSIPRRKGSIGPVVNAAGEILIPPLERQVLRNVYIITAYYDDFPNSHLSFKNAVNSTALTLRVGLPVFRHLFLPFVLKCNNIQFTKELIGDKKHWKGRYELHENPTIGADGKTVIGWRKEVLNAGFHHAVLEGEADGYGYEYGTHAETVSSTTLSQETVETDVRLSYGKPKMAVVTDAHGEHMRGKVLLDLLGLPLKKGDKPTHILYSIYEEKDFNELQLSG